MKVQKLSSEVVGPVITIFALSGYKPNALFRSDAGWGEGTVPERWTESKNKSSKVLFNRIVACHQSVVLMYIKVMFTNFQVKDFEDCDSGS